jgi:hypothetical protein
VRRHVSLFQVFRAKIQRDGSSSLSKASERDYKVQVGDSIGVRAPVVVCLLVRLLLLFSAELQPLALFLVPGLKPPHEMQLIEMLTDGIDAGSWRTFFSQ